MSEDMLRMMDENEEAKASEAKAAEVNEDEAGEAKVAEVSEAEANEITRVMAGGAPTEPAAAGDGVRSEGDEAVRSEGDEGVHTDADSDGGLLDDLDAGYEDEEERGPIWDAMVQTTKLQLRLSEDIAGATKVKLVTFNGIVPNKTDDELNVLSDKLASLFAYPSVGFVRIDTKTYKPGNPLL